MSMERETDQSGQFFECLENDCNAPAEIVDGHWMAAVDFDGSDVTLWADKIVCANGHWYELINEEKSAEGEPA